MEKVYDNDFFRTTSVDDFKIKITKPAPNGYPKDQPIDEYTSVCFEKSYKKRKQAFIDFALKSPSTDSTKGVFYELIRLLDGKSCIHEGVIEGALNYIDSRIDCADFLLTAMIRLWYQFRDSKLLSKELLQKVKSTILNFKYWPDEPGIDSMCYWTENHHMIFSTNEYLAGQAFENEIFTNSGHSGKQKMERAFKRINKWYDMRFYTGFSEWLSNVYFDESMPPLINLLDLAEDLELKRKSKDIIDLMLYDMALNSYYGIFSSTHGRTYTLEKTEPLKEDTIDTSKLMFGLGKFTNKNNMATVLLALSDYEIPQVIFDIANNTDTFESKQRVSIKFEDAKKWGFKKLTTENALNLLSFGGYSHPKTFNHLALMLDEFNWWDNKFFQELKPFKGLIRFGRHIGLTNLVANILKKDMSRNSMTEANLYTYRTKNYMLSTAQDYLKSMGGDQHHIWQATLDNEAIAFSTHPGGYKDSAPDGYWHGNGFMPKSVQHKNVNITIYNTPKMKTLVLEQILNFTHVFFPKDRYDKVVEQNGWIFGKANDGYIAIYSVHPYTWQKDGLWAEQEIIVQGRKNIYITEMGNKDVYGSFDSFIDKVSNSFIKNHKLNIEYHSPTQGIIKTGWAKDFVVNGEVIDTKDYDRYDNPTSKTKFLSDEIAIEFKGKKLLIKKR